MQASILLLEGELRGASSGGAVRIKDGDTEYDNTRTISSRTDDLTDLKNKLRDLVSCTQWETSLGLEGVRID